MHSVAPRTGAPEVTFAKDQLEYRPLVASLYDNSTSAVYCLTRWRFSDAERQQVVDGGDLYLTVMKLKAAEMQPMALSVGKPKWA